MTGAFTVVKPFQMPTFSCCTWRQNSRVLPFPNLYAASYVERIAISVYNWLNYAVVWQTKNGQTLSSQYIKEWHFGLEIVYFRLSHSTALICVVSVLSVLTLPAGEPHIQGRCFPVQRTRRQWATDEDGRTSGSQPQTQPPPPACGEIWRWWWWWEMMASVLY